MDPLAKKWNPSREYESMAVGELIPGMYFSNASMYFREFKYTDHVLRIFSFKIFLQCCFLEYRVP